MVCLAVCPLQAVKRNVKVQMEGMDYLTDIEEVWEGLVEADENGDKSGAIKEDNVKEANECLDKMMVVIKKFREHLQWEFNMQVMGATSNIQWGAVAQAELKRKREQEGLFTLTPEEVRKFEQEKLTYDRQLRLAGVSAGRGGGGAVRGSVPAAAAYDNVWLDGCAPTSSVRGKRSRGRGGRGGGAVGGASAAQRPGRPAVKCFKCEGPHFLRDCPKQPGS